MFSPNLIPVVFRLNKFRQQGFTCFFLSHNLCNPPLQSLLTLLEMLDFVVTSICGVLNHFPQVPDLNFMFPQFGDFIFVFLGGLKYAVQIATTFSSF